MKQVKQLVSAVHVLGVVGEVIAMSAGEVIAVVVEHADPPPAVVAVSGKGAGKPVPPASVRAGRGRERYLVIKLLLAAVRHRLGVIETNAPIAIHISNGNADRTSLPRVAMSPGNNARTPALQVALLLEPAYGYPLEGTRLGPSSMTPSAHTFFSIFLPKSFENYRSSLRWKLTRCRLAYSYFDLGGNIAKLSTVR